MAKQLFMKKISHQFENSYIQICNLGVNDNWKCTIHRILKERHIFEIYSRNLNIKTNGVCNFKTENNKLPISKLRNINDANIDVNWPL